MAKDFQSITKKIVLGLDKFSARSSVKEGYAEDLVNVDTNASGSVSTRTGYEGYYGWLPWRVKSIESIDTGDVLRVRLQGADLSSTKIGPVVIKGKLATGSVGNFTTTETVRYYPTFRVLSQVPLSAGTYSISKSLSDHGISSEFIAVGLGLVDSTSDRDNTFLLPNYVSINSATYAVTVNYTANLISSAYLYYRDLSASLGTRYHWAFSASSASFIASGAVLSSTLHGLSDGDVVELASSGTLPTGLSTNTLYYVVSSSTNQFSLSATEGGTQITCTDAGSGTHTWHRRSHTVSSATHNLANYNIVPFFFSSSGGVNTSFLPAEFTVANSGEAKFIYGPSITSLSGTVVLEAADTDNYMGGTISTSPGSQSIVEASATPFNFPSIYVYDSINGKNIAVLPDSWKFTEIPGEVTATFNNQISAESANIYWVSGSPVVDTIELDAQGDVADAGPFTDPQLTLWGIDHENNYTSGTTSGGHVTGLDSYRTAEETRLVAALGGNLYKAATFSEVASSHLLEKKYNINLARVDQANGLKLAPLFWTTYPGVVRTRGTIVDSYVVDNYALVTSASWVSPGVVDYVLSFAANVTFSTKVGTFDYLKVTGLANTEHTGSWRISSIISGDGTSVVTVRVENPSVTSDRFDETGCAGRAGVFTDFVPTEDEVLFIPGDTLVTGVSTDTALVVTSVVSGGTPGVYVKNVNQEIELPDGLQLTVDRTSALVPIGNIAGTADHDNIVRGDMVLVENDYSSGEPEDLARKVRVLGVQTQDSQLTTLASGSFSVVSAHRLNVGDPILLANGSAEDLTGQFTVYTTPTTTTFTVAETLSSTSGTATLVGSMLHLDEELTTRGGTAATTFTPEGRWVPVEAPVASGNLTSNTYYRYFDSNDETSQPALRSTSLGDKLYFTNGDDEVKTFDGTSISRAGIPRWQPFLFVNNTSSAGTLSNNVVSLTSINGDQSSNLLSETSGTKLLALSEGKLIYVQSAGTPANAGYAIVKKIIRDDTAGTTKVTYQPDTPFNLSGTAVMDYTVRTVMSFRYYFRLDLVDAQNNVISSAMTGSNDCVVRYSGSGAIEIKLVGLPAFDNYDYDGITLKVFRASDDNLLFRQITTKAVAFNKTDGYILVTDSISDESLATKNDVDALSDALKMAELGTGWQQPLKAKYISSAGGRLFLANLQEYPKAVLNLESSVGESLVAASSLAGKRLLFRKDSTDTATTTNMVDRVAFEFTYASSPGVRTVTGDNGSTTNAVKLTLNSAHGAVAGDWVYLYHADRGVDNSLRYAGWWQLTAASGSNIEFAYPGGATTLAGNDVTSAVFAASRKDVPVFLGADGNYNNNLDQSLTDVKFRAGVLLSNAINATMRMTNKDVTGMSAFVPWLASYSGGDYPSGQVTVTTTKNLDTTPGLKAPTFTSGFTLYVNDSEVTSESEAEFVSKRWPSRLIRSYPNYAEIFDNPESASFQGSDSVIDVNPQDGQEITAVVPFFSESVTSQGALQQTLLVFKTNSVYTVDTETRGISKLDSRGLGNTAPSAVASGKDCMFFVNESGVCRVNRNLSVDLLKDLTKLWKTSVNRDALAKATGTHYAVGRRYKLSVPVSGGTNNSQVYVYDYESEEGSAGGGWVRYTNHPTTGWANLASNAYWSSTSGDVFQVRDRGDATDFRDEDQPVAASEIILKAEDFGVPGFRKLIQNIVTFCDIELTSLTNLRVYTAQDLSSSFELQSTVSRGISDKRHFRTALSTRRGNFVQVKYTHQTKDEQFVFAGIAYTVGQLSYKLTNEAADG